MRRWRTTKHEERETDVSLLLSSKVLPLFRAGRYQVTTLQRAPCTVFVKPMRVADTFNGEHIPDKLGPLRLIVPHDKSPARWVRMPSLNHCRQTGGVDLGDPFCRVGESVGLLQEALDWSRRTEDLVS